MLPSRFDNLPNTVIECLALGVPVIGTIGASIEELVTPGRDGELVPIADPRALAAAITARWRAGAVASAARGCPPRSTRRAAVDRLLALASLRDGSRCERSLVRFDDPAGRALSIDGDRR